MLYLKLNKHVTVCNIYVYTYKCTYLRSGSTSILTVNSCLANVKYVTIIITNSEKLYYKMTIIVEKNTFFVKHCYNFSNVLIVYSKFNFFYIIIIT